MCTLADNEMYSKLFTELSAIVGYEEREWVQEPTPGGWRSAHKEPDSCSCLRLIERF